MTVALWTAVAAVGGIGSVLRFLVDQFVARRTSSAFPLGTLTVNITGSLALGLLAGLALGPDAALLLGTAAVGSYTTFSTWMLETHRLGEGRQYVFMVANVLGSLVLGVTAAQLGQSIGTHW